ncbi:adhesion G protein-coupled receptor E4-like [Anneissia japonica]|uniref:adhesion G protein-coupled receptor E4-like n=1 Tax=Anneissia japonica TaxID=1529436 RepID=UPI0014255DDF|nr:adhesion G protein-coupled receptor E4-like [Anneissia japonica]
MIELIREAVCVFWNEEFKQWSRDGCQVVSTDVSGNVECSCTHTTIFGILLPTELKDDIDLYSIMLRVVTYSTGLFSIVSLIAVAFIMFHKQKQQNPFDVERTSVMKNLIAVSFLMTCSYLSTLELGEITLACIIAGVVLEYLYIAMVMWIFIDVFNIFTKLHNLRCKRCIYYHLAIGWGFSAFVALLFFGTYRGYDDSDGCWTNMEVGVIAAFATPTFLILLASIIMLLVCLTWKTKLKGKQRESYIIQTKCISRGICVLLPMFLTTWTLSVQVSEGSEGSTYRMLFFGMFALHGAFIAAYCYYNFRYRSEKDASSGSSDSDSSDDDNVANENDDNDVDQDK